MCIVSITKDTQTAEVITTHPDKTKIDQTKLINHVDFTQRRREHLFGIPKVVEDWCVEHLLRRKDRRNLGIFLVGINILMTSVPLAGVLVYCEQTQVLSTSQLIMLGVFYLVFHLKTFARSFILSIHYSTHCSIFNKQFRYLDHIWTSGLCNMFGIPLGLYYPHHIGMHHSEDNVAPLDMSSTMDYDRSSKWNHFKYMFRFVSRGYLELPFRLVQMRKWKLAAICVTGTTTFVAALVLFNRYSPIASIFVGWLPWLICSFALMQGNFKEHIFVDPDEYWNNYKSTVTCINAPSNALTFNTGYHVEHHEEPGLPWFQLPELFLKNIEKHAKNDSFVFSGIGTMEVGTMVLREQFDELADYYINIGQPKRTKEELIQEFKRRLTPVGPNHKKKSE
jgi:fatty acid desaturase